MYDVVVKSSRSLSHLLMSSCTFTARMQWTEAPSVCVFLRQIHIIDVIRPCSNEFDGQGQRSRTLSEACVRFMFGKNIFSLWLASSYVCLWHISGTAEQICAKSTRKTCLVSCSEKFEGHSQRSKVKVTRDKKTKTALFGPFAIP